MLEDISLIIFLGNGITHFLFLLLGLRLHNFFVDNLLFMLDLPLILVGHHLLGADGLRTVLVDLLHQVDASLILLAPLVLLELPLLLGLEPGEVLDQLLLSFFILSLLKVELLKIDNLLSAAEAFLILELSDLLLACECLVKHNLVAFLLNSELLLTEEFLGLVVADELEISFDLENMLLSLHLLLLLILFLPLFLEHLSLNFGELAILHFSLHACVLLPVKDGLGIVDSLFLLLDFPTLTLLFGGQIKLPKLSVNVLLGDLLLGGTLLVHELLFTLHLALINEELALLLPQIVSGVLESLLESAVHLVDSLLLSALLELVQTDGHLLSDLLGGLQIGHELLLVDAVLSIEQGLQSMIIFNALKMAVTYLILRSSKLDSWRRFKSAKRLLTMVRLTMPSDFCSHKALCLRFMSPRMSEAKRVIFYRQRLIHPHKWEIQENR